MHRLEAIYPSLISRIRRSAAETQRALAAAACQFAVESSHLSDPLVEEVLTVLMEGQRPSSALVDGLRRLAGALDTDYFDLQDAAENGSASQDEVVLAFSKARAASSLSFALASDPVIAAVEAICEAAATADDKHGLKNRLEALLNA